MWVLRPQDLSDPSDLGCSLHGGADLGSDFELERGVALLAQRGRNLRRKPAAKSRRAQAFDVGDDDADSGGGNTAVVSAPPIVRKGQCAAGSWRLTGRPARRQAMRRSRPAQTRPRPPSAAGRSRCAPNPPKSRLPPPCARKSARVARSKALDAVALTRSTPESGGPPGRPCPRRPSPTGYSATASSSSSTSISTASSPKSAPWSTSTCSSLTDAGSPSASARSR